MLIKILHFRRLVCGQHADANEVVDAPEPDALRLVGMGAAEHYVEPEPEVVDAPEPDEIQTQDPEPVNQDPKPKAKK